MATTKGKTTSSAKTSSASKSAGRAKPAANKAQSAKSPIRREVGAAVCFFMSLLSLLVCFNVNAILLDLLSSLGKGLLGWGFYTMPLMLLLACGILLFHGGRPVSPRVWCALLIPVAMAMLYQLLKGDTSGTGWSIISELFDDGKAGTGGGILGGGLALILKAVISKVGAIIVSFVSLGVLFFIAANAYERIMRFKERPRYSYEPPQPKAEQPSRSAAGTPPVTAASRRKIIDIPLDDEPVAKPVEDEKKGLFNRRSQVKTPEEHVIEPEANNAISIETKRFQQPQPELEEVPRHGEFVIEYIEGVEEAPAESPAIVSAIIQNPIAAAQISPKERAVSAKKQAEDNARLVQEIESNLEEPPAYKFPPFELLSTGKGVSAVDGAEEIRLNTTRLNETLKSFGIEAAITNVTRGPSVTRYELELEKGVKLSRVTGLADDIALSLGAAGVRIAAITGKISLVGVEVPNKLVSKVYLRDLLSSQEFQSSKSRISFAVGNDIGANNIVGDIGKLPHMLIAGTTGSGKSVCMNSLIVSLLYKATPEEVRLIMIDPKMIELNVYNGIPHLLIPVVTDPKKASGALQWAVSEMMKRYQLLSEVNMRDIASYNAYADKHPEMQRLPQIVILIDELADLMLVAAKEVEESICRIAQMARAAGMHLIIATQRPSADVITGIMKANIPSRIAFAVASQLESRIILDTMGAEKLVGYGDMLYNPLGTNKPMRVQGCLITSEEVEAVTDYIKQSCKPEYSSEIMEHIEHAADKKSSGGGGIQDDTGKGGDCDDLLPAAVEVILETGQASVSMLQRRLKLGYARAARIVDEMEERGIVGPFEGSKPRQMLITREQWGEMQMKGTTVPAFTAAPEDLPWDEDGEEMQ